MDEVFRSLETNWSSTGSTDAGVGLFTFDITTGFAQATRYDNALTEMNNLFALQPPGELNIAYFISDGTPSPSSSFTTGPGSPLDNAIAAGTIVNTYSIGSQAAGECNPGQPLRVIADATLGQCTEVLDPSQLQVVLPATAATQLQQLEVLVNGTSIATQVGPVPSTLNITGADAFPQIVAGANTIEAVGTAVDGTMVTASISVTGTGGVNPPSISCPADVVVNNDAGQCGATVTYADPVVTDDCPGATFSCSPASGSFFPTGTTAVTCTATDISGLTDTCSFNVTVNDNEAPVASCPGDITVGNDAGQCGAVVSFTANVSDNCPGATISCTPASGSSFAIGTTSVSCTATDAAGNTDSCSFNVTVDDNEAPVASCPADITQSADAGACTATVTYSATVSDNCPGASISCSPASGTSFGVGTTTVSCTATDAAGNTDSCSFNVTISDDEDPTISCPGGVMTDSDPGQCDAAVSFSVTASDACGSATVSCTPASGSVFPVGSTTVNCTATDAAGNTATCSFNVDVIDNEAPVANCPADITVAGSGASCDANVTYTANVSDNCPGASISCSPASGTVFALGTTSVSCTATDAAGNTDTCSFNVTVTGTATPTITCPADITQSADAGNCSAVVNFTASATGGCSGTPIVTCTPASGSSFPVGTTTVSCTADSGGATDTCSFNVTVVDNEAPVANCPADITVAGSGGSCDATVSYTANVSDNCPGASISCSPASGSVFALGTTSVSCTATDAAGNTDTCSFNVTVTGTAQPTITCPVDITIGADAGACSAVVNFTATATGGCGGTPTVTCTPASGSTFGVGTTTVSCTATAGSLTDTCSFTVTVTDNEDPTISCPASITTGNDAGQCGASVSYSVSASDNCGSATVNCSPASGAASSPSAPRRSTAPPRTPLATRRPAASAST